MADSPPEDDRERDDAGRPEADPERADSATVPPFVGHASVALAILLAASGLLLVVGYRPDPVLAWLDLVDLHQQMPGALAREGHVWASRLLVVVMLLQLFGELLRRGYRSGRTWNGTLIRVALVLAFAWTGDRLRHPLETASLAIVNAVHILILPLLVLAWIALRRRAGNRDGTEPVSED